MNDGELLLRAVLEKPEDDTVRLIYADWLQENGDALWAELIRLEINKPPKSGYRKGGLSKRLKNRLLKQHNLTQRREGDQHVNCWMYTNRGFVDNVTTNRYTLDRIVPLFRQHPISEVNVCEYGCEREAVNEWPFYRADGIEGRNRLEWRFFYLMEGGVADCDALGPHRITYPDPWQATAAVRKMFAKWCRTQLKKETGSSE